MDEPTYVTAGRSYLRLLLHGDIANPAWLENLQHPALPKLILGVFAAIAEGLLHVDPIIGARMAAVLAGTLTVVAIFGLGQRTFGYWPALLAAVALGVSPWHAYWSSLAFLDPFLALFLTLAVLLALQANRQPGWILLASVAFGLAFTSKYTAVLGLPALCILCLFSMNTRRASHWLAVAAGPLVSAATILFADPAIWADPWTRISASVTWQLDHATGGHLSFYAGQLLSHTPWWVASYVIVLKNSFTIIGFAVLLILSHASPTRLRRLAKTPSGVAVIWCALMLLGFSFLSIVVADNYILPMAPPVTMCAAVGCVEIARKVNKLLKVNTFFAPLIASTLLIVPSALGLVEFPSGAGFTSEILRPANLYIPVADVGYRAAIARIERDYGPIEVTVPYFPEAATWAISRESGHVRIAPGSRSLDQAIIVLYPAFYAQYNLIDAKITRDFQLVSEIREGPVTYSYIFAPRRAASDHPSSLATSELGNAHSQNSSGS